jgi:hypothetical protein
VVMIQRKGELSASRIDREWAHLIALPSEQLVGKNHDIIDEFCRRLSPCPRGHTVQRDNVRYHVFCSGDASHLSGSAQGSAASSLIRRTAVAEARGSSGARAISSGQSVSTAASITNFLPDLREGSVERQKALINLNNIRWVLMRHDLTP